MSFTEALKTVFYYKYATFKGRASRSEFWWANLVLIILNFVLPAINATLYWIVFLIVIIPSTAVAFRRLHDTNRRGWHVIVNYVLWAIAIVMAGAMLFAGFLFFLDPAIFDAVSTGKELDLSNLSNDYDPMHNAVEDSDVLFSAVSFGASMIFYFLFVMAALVHTIFLIVIYIFKGDESENRFGSNPLLNQSTEGQVQEVNDQSDTIDLNSLTVKQLKELAVEKDVHILSKDTKAVIIRKLSE